MKKVDLERLAASPSRQLTLEIREYIPEFATLTPVAAHIEVVHNGTFLDLQGTLDTIVTLLCHRCLQQFNQKLSHEIQEVIWLGETTLAEEQEITPEDLYETLPSNGVLDLEDWIYQHLCLALPTQQLCEPHCPGLAVENTPDPTDHRWQGLAGLRDQLGNR